MSLSHPWPKWFVLLGALLLPAAGPTCFGAEPVPPQPLAPATVRATVPAPPAPAKARGSLLGRLSDALGAGDPYKARNAEVERANEANIRSLETHFRPQFQQLLYVELAYLRRVCKVDAQPFAEIAKATRPDFAAMVREHAVARLTRMTGQTRSDSQTTDPRFQVQRFLTPLVEAKLGPQQAQHYRQECDQRAKSRQRAVVLNLVAAMDDRLVLTAQQRTALVQSLSSDYQHGWEQFLHAFSSNAQYLPAIRDELVAPLLDERQKTVWQQTPKVTLDSFSGLQFVRTRISDEATEIQEIARMIEEAPNDK